MTDSAQKILGIIGGVGPLASAAFVNTYYRLAPRVQREQEWGRIILDSDPGFPARSPDNLRSRAAEMTSRLEDAAVRLLRMECDELVVCCCTLHCLLPELDPAVSSRFINLPGLALKSLQQKEGQWTLLCADGSRFARVYEDSAGWSAVKDRIVVLSDRDQRTVQQTINELKVGVAADTAWETVAPVVGRAGTQGIIFGCTEFHLISSWLRENAGNIPYEVIDPLVEVALGGAGSNE